MRQKVWNFKEEKKEIGKMKHVGGGFRDLNFWCAHKFKMEKNRTRTPAFCIHLYDRVKSINQICCMWNWQQSIKTIKKIAYDQIFFAVFYKKILRNIRGNIKLFD